jgi:leucyl/phenylalanyl-tRNA--protein transferase
MLPSRYFPPAETADADGLVAVGGRLDPDWIIDAYAHGIFPWPSAAGQPVPWFSPDPRGVLELDALHVSRSLARTLRGRRFEATSDRDFAGVIQGCATARRRRQGGTWITPELAAAYCRLYELGYAHSVEVWRQGELAGGIYGVALGAAFFAESMFHRVRDASKVALMRLVEHLRRRGYLLFDIQQLTPHMARLGAIAIPRAEYLRRLEAALTRDVPFGSLP